MILYIFLFLLSEVITVTQTSFRPRSGVKITNIHQEIIPVKRIKRELRNLRILIHYDQSFNDLKNKEEFKKNAIEPAVKFWEDSLIVNSPATSPILIERECPFGYRFDYLNGNKIKVCKEKCSPELKCSLVVIPEKYLAKCHIDDEFNGFYRSTGEDNIGAVDTDLIILVSYSSKGCSENSFAYSTTCELENKINRPVLGSLNICPKKETVDRNFFWVVSAIKHEIVHILGFNAALYAFFRDKYGNPLTKRDSNGYPKNGFIKLGLSEYYKSSEKVIKEETYQAKYEDRTEIQTRHILVTPNIKKETQNHFNCSTLEGVYLEDYGTKNSVLSHFERRILYNELMTAAIQDYSLVSRFTMAFLEDTGWYHPDYMKADKYLFAKNAGCDFVTKTCYEYMSTKSSRHLSIAPYCKQSGFSSNKKCSDDLKYKEICNIGQGHQVSQKYKYSKENHGSFDHFADFCPYYQTYRSTDRDGFITNGICEDYGNNVARGFDSYGAASACFEFNNVNINTCGSHQHDTKLRPMCQRYECSYSHRLVVYVNDHKYQCRFDGQDISIRFKTNSLTFSGTVKCPKCSLLCDNFVCNSPFSLLFIECAEKNGQCFNDTSLDLQCSGFQIPNYTLYSVILSIVVFWILL